MKLTHKLSGFDELDKLLSELPKSVENKIMQNAVNKAMRAALPEMKAAAPTHIGKQSPSSKQYGTLRRNMRVIRLRRVAKGQKGARIDTGNAFWGLILELGSRFIPAMPWFAPAFRKQQSTITRVLGEELGKGIEAEAGKYKGGKR